MNKVRVMGAISTAILASLIVGNIAFGGTIETDIENKVPSVVEVKPFNTDDYIQLIENYDLNNYGVSQSQVIYSNIRLKYDKGQVLSASTETNKAEIYKDTLLNDNISSFDMHTEYKDFGNGCDTCHYIEFTGKPEKDDILEDALTYIFDSNTVSDVIRHIKLGDNSIEYQNALVKFNSEHGFKYDRFGKYEIKIYVNSGILNDSGIDTVKLSETEPIMNDKAFLENKNWYSQNSNDISKIFGLEKSNDVAYIDSITYKYSYVREFDRDNNIEKDNFLRYNIEKDIETDDNVKITFHIDEYDRYNVGRLGYIMLSGTVDKEVLETYKDKHFPSIDMKYRSNYSTEKFKSFSKSY